MLRKIGSNIRRKQGGVSSSVKCRFDVSLDTLEGLPSKVSQCRIHFERSPKVQMSKVQECESGTFRLFTPTGASQSVVTQVAMANSSCNSHTAACLPCPLSLRVPSAAVRCPTARAHAPSMSDEPVVRRAAHSSHATGDQQVQQTHSTCKTMASRDLAALCTTSWRPSPHGRGATLTQRLPATQCMRMSCGSCL